MCTELGYVLDDTCIKVMLNVMLSYIALYRTAPTRCMVRTAASLVPVPRDVTRSPVIVCAPQDHSDHIVNMRVARDRTCYTLSPDLFLGIILT